jgi:hypothetical protein
MLSEERQRDIDSNKIKLRDSGPDGDEQAVIAAVVADTHKFHRVMSSLAESGKDAMARFLSRAKECLSSVEEEWLRRYNEGKENAAGMGMGMGMGMA